MLQIIASSSPIVQFLYLPVERQLWLMLIYVGWIPIVWVLLQGMLMLYLDQQNGKYLMSQKWITLAIDVPHATAQTPKAVENIFAIVKGTKSVVTFKEKWSWGKFLIPTSFEIVSEGGYIQFYIRTLARFRDVYEAAIYAQYPDATISEVEDYTLDIPDDYPNETHEVFGGELKFENDNYFPIKTWPYFEHMGSKDEPYKDPLINLFEILGKMRHGERFWYQILVHPNSADGVLKQGGEFIKKTYGREVAAPPSTLQKIAGPVAWIPEEILGQFGFGAAGGDGGDKQFSRFFVPTNTEKSQLDGVAMKISKLGFMSKIRWCYIARKEVYRKGEVNSLWKGHVALFTQLDWNSLKYEPDTMPRDDYFWMIWEYRGRQRDLIKAMKSRSWSRGAKPMYLNIEELATLWHFPSVDVKTPLIKKTVIRRAEAPNTLPSAADVATSASVPLVEVDADGNPIGQPVISRPEERGLGHGLGDILPTGPLIELDDEDDMDDEFVTDEELDEMTPPNLPT